MADRAIVPAGGDPAHQLIVRSFHVAAQAGTRCRPVHLATALAEDGGGIGHALRPLRAQPPINSGQPGHGNGSSYLFLQVQQAASEFAAGRGEPRGIAHLALAMLDQGDPEMLRTLAGAGINAAAVRRAALAELGAPPELEAISFPPLTPAGTLDRPALDLDQLDPRAVRVLSWRQQHLPLSQVRSRAHLAALESLEQRAAWGVAEEAGVDDDQRYSLLDHHRRAVEQRLGPAHAEFDRPSRSSRPRANGSGFIAGRRRRRLTFMVGWPTWFSNRRAGIRDGWFRIISSPAYRGQPGVDD